MHLFSQRRKLHGVLLDTDLDNGSQCLSCDAACCRGFPSVRLTSDEYARYEKRGGVRLEFTLTGEFYLIIENGCDFLVGNRCSIYEQRPAICRRFSCRPQSDN